MMLGAYNVKKYIKTDLRFGLR
jgi:hypothetical protein